MQPDRSSSTPSSASLAQAGRRRGLWWLALAMLALLLAGLAWQALQRPPSFDGAMNLQVAWSLAEGEGYRRTYGERQPFPREVQTNVPFIAPAALVYAVFGMGIAQSQVVNLLYLLGLLLVCYALVRRQAGPVPAALGALLVLVTPGLTLYGLRGYGEVPALFWALLALYAFGDGQRRRGVVLAGLCLGLALATKTVMAMTCAIFAAGFALVVLARTGVAWAQRWRQLAWLAGAAIVPQLLVELWRLLALGGLPAWLGWWRIELTAIGKQAGVVSGYQDTTGLASKVGQHLDLLSQMYGLPPLLTLAWLAGPLLLAAVLASGLLPGRRTRGWQFHHGLVLMLILAALAYFVWWLAVTPTQKAWHRRILDGSLMLNLSWVLVAAWWWRALAPEGRVYACWRRGLAWLPTVALAALAVNFFFTDLSGQLRRSTAYTGFHSLVAALRDLPQDATVAGIAWYSAPALSLLAQRPLVDFNDLIVPSLAADQAVYLVRDRVTPESHAARILTTYANETVADAGRAGRIHRLHLATANPATFAAPASASMLEFNSELKEPLAGFYQPERDGRWMSSNAYARLLHPAGSVLAVDVYLPSLSRYRPAGEVQLQVWIDDCHIAKHTFAAGGLHALRFAIAPACGLADGQPVLVRLAGNALMKGSITRDGRALFAKMQRLGFVPDDTRPARPDQADGGAGSQPGTADMAPAPAAAAAKEEAPARAALLPAGG
ncbi:MAG: glycosyltransferase family 39 protein [Lysobacterales bacterium]